MADEHAELVVDIVVAGRLRGRFGRHHYRQNTPSYKLLAAFLLTDYLR
jgi:hypothetical protein